MIETKSLKFSYDGKFVFEFPNIKLKNGAPLDSKTFPVLISS